MNRFVLALVAYGALALLAVGTIDDPRMRGVTLALLAMFALKTWVRRRSGADLDAGNEGK